MSVKIDLSRRIEDPQEVVERIAQKEGPMTLYSWFENFKEVPLRGATFMRDCIYEPIYARKRDVSLNLYSLKGSWDFLQTVKKMSTVTRSGEAIQALQNPSVTYIQGSDFFRFCASIPKTSPLSGFIEKELPKKEWLFNISKEKIKPGKTVEELFDRSPSVFDCIKDKYCSAAYSAFQYYEGYYLVREPIRKAIADGQKSVQITFVLPNDEGKYYSDLLQELGEMLRLDFGKDIEGMQIEISFHFFTYKTPKDRPYLKSKDETEVLQPEAMRTYFDYAQPWQLRPSPRFLRDVINNLDVL